MSQTIGTCSLCGGRVCTRESLSSGPLPPACASCGAIAAMHGPLVPMVPAAKPATPPVYVQPIYYGPGWPPPQPWQVLCGASTNEARITVENVPGEFAPSAADIEAMLGLAALKDAGAA